MTLYYIKDHLGSTRVVVDREDGSAVETRNYDPMGELMPALCSQEEDVETREKYSAKELDNEGTSNTIGARMAINLFMEKLTSKYYIQ